MIVASILGPEEPWFTVVWVAGFASLGKQIFSSGREHFPNPAALSLAR
jgi:hypothetical protein